MTVIAELRRLHVQFGSSSQPVQALTRIDLEVHEAEILGIVGEAGAGKSTVLRSLLRLLSPTTGEVRLGSDNITTWSERRLRKLRNRMTMVFHNPRAALNPRMTVRRLIEEPLILHLRMAQAARAAEVERLAEQLGLARAELDSLPGNLQPGRLQLVCLARAIATKPQLLVLDEPLATLDTAAAADMLTMLDALRRETRMGIVITSDDIATIRPIIDRLAVIYLGEIVEQGPAADIVRDPLHPYTQALLSAHLAADPTQRGRRIRLRGEAPAPQERTPGCGFAPRCPIAEARCRSGAPTPNQIDATRSVACVRVLEGTSRIPLSR